MEKDNIFSELKKYIQEEKFIKIVFSDKKMEILVKLL